MNKSLNFPHSGKAKANMTKDEVVFDRNRFVMRIEQRQSGWDIIIIGGGATGLGVAMDAANRGYKTLLVEQSDFAKSTSSRSTKLIHGGVRYLAQGNIKLVYEALNERELLFRNAPHVVKRQSFIIPSYSTLEKLKYFIGLKAYDLLAGSEKSVKSKTLNPSEVEKLLPNIEVKGLKGGINYFDGQFDDARLAINIAQTAAEQGAVLLNYFKVKTLIKDDTGSVKGVVVEDGETNKRYHLRSKVVVNATGVFVDEILRLDKPAHESLVRPSQGIHLVLDKSFLPGNNALMIPKTSDGRVLFAIPWHNHLLVGTTDTPLNEHSLEPVALEQEISFILSTLETYLIRRPSRMDVLSVFAGLRPLAAPSKKTNNTKEISRSHKIIVSDSGLITITGGKWTTFRKMAEDTIDKAIKVAGLKQVKCNTENLKIHGYRDKALAKSDFDNYGSDEEHIKELMQVEHELCERLHQELPYLKAHVVWAVRSEMARTVEDVLARRLRILFLNSRIAIEAAPKVAEIMANEFKYDVQWQMDQLAAFRTTAYKYSLESHSMLSHT